jgi:hypothetical protein
MAPRCLLHEPATCGVVDRLSSASACTTDVWMPTAAGDRKKFGALTLRQEIQPIVVMSRLIAPIVPTQIFGGKSLNRQATALFHYLIASLAF